MRLRILDPVLKSKQHSRGQNNGRTFTVASYTSAKFALNMQAREQIRKQGYFQPTDKKVAVRISYRANRMNVDNVSGFILDALEGAAYIKDGQVDVLTVKKRRNGENWLFLNVRILNK